MSAGLNTTELSAMSYQLVAIALLPSITSAAADENTSHRLWRTIEFPDEAVCLEETPDRFSYLRLEIVLDGYHAHAERVEIERVQYVELAPFCIH